MEEPRQVPLVHPDAVILGEPLTWPDFRIPFTTSLHPDFALAGQHTRDWAARTGLAIGDAAASYLADARPERMTARVHPYGDQNVVNLATDWLVWIMALDDQCDEGELRNDHALARKVFTEIGSVLTDNLESVRTVTTLGAALADLWRDTASSMSLSWRQHFRQGTQTVLATVEREMTRQARGSMPTEVELAAERVGGSLNRTATEAWLACAGLEIPAEAFGVGGRPGPAEQLLDIADEIIWWCNDILSLEKDIASHDLSNLVIAIRHVRDCSYQSAVDSLASRVGPRVDDLKRAEHTLVEMVGADAEPVVREACALVGRHLRANIEWLSESTRYRRAQFVPTGSVAEYLDSVRPNSGKAAQ
jgi:Terpene synthase family 2, C-terminal metal binding